MRGILQFCETNEHNEGAYVDCGKLCVDGGRRNECLLPEKAVLSICCLHHEIEPQHGRTISAGLRSSRSAGKVYAKDIFWTIASS